MEATTFQHQASRRAVNMKTAMNYGELAENDNGNGHIHLYYTSQYEQGYVKTAILIKVPHHSYQMHRGCLAADILLQVELLLMFCLNWGNKTPQILQIFMQNLPRISLYFILILSPQNCCQDLPFHSHSSVKPNAREFLLSQFCISNLIK